MANNRIFLRCRGCGAAFNLGKTFAEGYSRGRYTGEADLLTELNNFYDKHTFCRYKNEVDESNIEYLEPKFKHTNYHEENAYEIAYEKVWDEEDK